MRIIRIFILTLALTAMMPRQIMAQNSTSTESELILKLKYADDKSKINIYKDLLAVKSSKKTTRIIAKGAKKLYKSEDAECKIAGMQLLTAIKGEKAMPMLFKALPSDDQNVRKDALDLMKPYANDKVVSKVVNICGQGEAVADALDWLGDIKNDTQMEFVLNQLQSTDKNVVSAAIRAIFKIDNLEGIDAVKPMFGGEYQDVIKESMVTYEGDYRTLMNDLLKNGTDRQKIAALQIVELHPTVDVSRRVQELLNSDNEKIKDMAFHVLKLVVPMSQADFLKALLEYCDEQFVEDVQFAIKNAMKDAPENVKNDFVSTLKHIKPDVMPRYYKVFAYFGTELCVEKLIDAYQNGDYKKEAKEALLLVKNRAYKERISKVLEN